MHRVLAQACVTAVLVVAGCKGRHDESSLGHTHEASDSTDSASVSIAPATTASPQTRKTLSEARKGFVTKAVDNEPRDPAAPTPPPKMFTLVHYTSPVGPLVAYITPKPSDAARHPAILWIEGGFSNSISEDAWEPAPRDNDQSARAFREAGLVLFKPSMRGGNDNPGHRECLYGEVDDILAAAEYLKAVDYVDPNRIYLGGHSTGGTLSLLVAETGGPFRSVIAFGAMATLGICPLVGGRKDKTETELRSPGYFIQTLHTPTLLIEGEAGNSKDLAVLTRLATGSPVQTVMVPNASHFSVLAPLTEVLARKIVADTGPKPNITLTVEEATAAMKAGQP